MYTPKHDAEPGENVVRGLVAQYPLATVIVPRADGAVEIAHVPVLLADGALRLHVARANRIWRDMLEANRPGDVVVVFSGPQGYVSPTWYESSVDDVPTWNYAVAHAHVTAPMEMDRAELVRFLDDFAIANEDPAAPWRLDEHPAESLEALLLEIVGLRLPVARWDTRFKLSRNRTARDHAGVVAGLSQRGRTDDHELAARMRDDRQ